MKTRSAKNKGKRLQNNVRDLLLETFTELEPDDIKSTTMGEIGEDIQLSPAARKLIPYAIECKNQEKINIWESLKQAESNSEKGKPAQSKHLGQPLLFATTETGNPNEYTHIWVYKNADDREKKRAGMWSDPD